MKIKYLSCLKIVLISMVLILCASCQTHKTAALAKEDAEILACANLKKKLHKYLVNIPQKSGEKMVLQIPEKIIFIEHTPRFSSGAKSFLKNIEDLIRCYEIVDLKVACYVRDDAVPRAQTLADEQAHQLGNRLCTENIDGRIVYAIGETIDTNKKIKPGGITKNSAEISFEAFDK